MSEEFRVKVEPTQPNFWVTDDDVVHFPFYDSDDAFDLARLLNDRTLPASVTAVIEAARRHLLFRTAATVLQLREALSNHDKGRKP